MINEAESETPNEDGNIDSRNMTVPREWLPGKKATHAAVSIVVVLTLMLASAAVIIMSSSNEAAPVTAKASITTDPYVRAGMLSTIFGWNPLNMHMAEDYIATYLVYSSLFTYDQDWEGPVNDLATSWCQVVHTDGSMTTYINITENAYFRSIADIDDVSYPLDARDVSYTYNLIKNNSGGTFDLYLEELSYFTPYYNDASGRWDHVSTWCPYQKATLIDDISAVPILPRLIWGPEGENYEAKALGAMDPGEQVGSGPFVFEDWERDSWYKFKTAPNYHGAADYGAARTVSIPGLLYSVVSDTSAMCIEINTGVLDCGVLTGDLNAFIDVLGKDASVNVFKAAVSENGITDIAINAIPDAFDDLGYLNRHPALLDPFVRKAIAMTLNKDYIVNDQLDGLPTLAHSVVQPGFWQADIENIVPYDPAGAKAMLQANGWEDLDGDGWLEATAEAYGVQMGWFPVGTELSGIRCQAIDTDQNYALIALAWPGWADDAGIQLIGTVETETTMINKAWYAADYDIWIWHWGWGPEPIGGALSVWQTSEIEKAGNNCQMPMGPWWAHKGNYTTCPYISPEMITEYGIDDEDTWDGRFSAFDQNLTDAWRILDVDERKVILDKLQQWIYDTHTELVPYYDLGLYGYSDYRFDNWGDWEAHDGLNVASGLPWVWFQLEPTDENRLPIFVTPPLTSYEAVVDEPITFTIGVSDPDGDPIGLNWSFGDGEVGGNYMDGDTTVERIISFTHVYTEAATDLTLTVALNDYPQHASEVIATSTVDVVAVSDEPPVVLNISYDPMSAIVGQEVSWIIWAVDPERGPDGIGLLFNWVWDDGTNDISFYENVTSDIPVADSQTHAWSEPGIYSVTIFVVDGPNNVSVSVLYTISGINSPPNASFTVLPEFGYVGTCFDFDASYSWDLEDPTEALQVRWDWENDGFWDTDWTTEKQAAHAYDAVGTYTVALQVMDTGGLLTSTDRPVVVREHSGTIEPATYDLSFTTTDAVFDPFRPYVYISDKYAKKLHFVNLTTGSVDKTFEFSYMTESLAMTPDGSRLFVALLTREHSPYWWDEEGHIGYIASIDLSTQVKDREYMINEDPGDIVATSNGQLVVGSGSGQWSYIRVFDAEDGIQLSAVGGFRQLSRLALHPSESMVYAANVDVHPSDIFRYDLNQNGEITYASDSPYHGDYRMEGNVWVSPLGDELVTRGGDVFTAGKPIASDMIFIASMTPIGSLIGALCYDTTSRIIFTGEGSSARFYSMDNHLYLGEIVADLPVGCVSVYGDIFAMLLRSTGSTTIWLLDHPLPGGSNNTAPVAHFTVDPSEGTTLTDFVFNASASYDEQDPLSELEFRWDVNGDGSWDTAYDSNPVVVERYDVAGIYDVKLEVRDSLGWIDDLTVAVEVTFEDDPGSPGPTHDPFMLPYTVTDAVFDPVRPYAYVSSKYQNKVYFVNIDTGMTEKQFEFEHMTESLTMTPDGSRLYVALLYREHSYYWFDGHVGEIGCFDLNRGVKDNQFVINEDPFDLVATSNGQIVVSSGSGQWDDIRVYDVDDGTLLGSAGIRQLSRLSLHPTEMIVYAADTDVSPSDIERFDLLPSGGITAAGDSPYHGDHRMSGNLWVSPLGDELVTRGGDVFTAGKPIASDMIFIASMTPIGSLIGALCYDTTSRIIFTGEGTALRYYSMDNYLSVGEYVVDLPVGAVSVRDTTIAMLLRGTGMAEIQLVPHPLPGGLNNTAPVANFTVTPQVGCLGTVFTVDASASYDLQDPVEALEVRWDWEGDGIWDTEWSTDKIASHQILLAGNHTIVLEARDTDGMTDTTSRVVQVFSGSFEQGMFPERVFVVVKSNEHGTRADYISTMTPQEDFAWNLELTHIDGARVEVSVYERNISPARLVSESEMTMVGEESQYAYLQSDTVYWIVFRYYGKNGFAVLTEQAFPLHMPKPHDPILITSNTDFTYENGVVQGDGSVQNPYVIEGWNIEADTASGISIMNTEAHFVIRDVNVFDGLGNGSRSGISLCDVTNGSVEASKVTNCMWGIAVFSCDGIDVCYNNLTNCYYGVGVVDSNRIGIWLNHISDSLAMGIAVNYTTNIGPISNNTIVNSGFYGIDIAWCQTGGWISSNTIAYSGRCGIRLTGQNEHLLIFHNTLLNNIVQAFDDNPDGNSWDFGYPLGGNYWSDYVGVDLFSGPNQDLPGSDGIGDTPYTIGVFDRYPLMAPYPG